MPASRSTLRGESLFLDCTAERLVPRDITETFSDDDASDNDEPGSPTPRRTGTVELLQPAGLTKPSKMVKKGRARKLISLSERLELEVAGTASRPAGLVSSVAGAQDAPEATIEESSLSWQEANCRTSTIY